MFDYLSQFFSSFLITPCSLNVKRILYNFLEIAKLGCKTFAKRLGQNCKTCRKIARLCHKIAISQNLLEITKKDSFKIAKFGQNQCLQK